MSAAEPGPYRVVMSNASGELDSRTAHSIQQVAAILVAMVIELGSHIEVGDTFTVEGPEAPDSREG